MTEINETIYEKDKPFFIINLKMVVSLTQLFNYKSISNQEISSTNLDKDNVEEKKILLMFHYYANSLRVFFFILAILYYYLLLIVVIDTGLLYICLKIEGYLITLCIHVLWNVIKFFMLSSLLFGTIYDLLLLAINDSVSLFMLIFDNNFDFDSFCFQINLFFNYFFY